MIWFQIHITKPILMITNIYVKSFISCLRPNLIIVVSIYEEISLPSPCDMTLSTVQSMFKSFWIFGIFHYFLLLCNFTIIIKQAGECFVNFKQKASNLLSTCKLRLQLQLKEGVSTCIRCMKFSNATLLIFPLLDRNSEREKQSNRKNKYVWTSLMPN